jgi:TldD protein
MHVHASNPQPGDLAPLVACAAARRALELRDPKRPTAGDLGEHEFDRDAVLRLVDDAAQRAAHAARDGVQLVACAVEWIGFRQAILVARPGEPARADVRTSSRIRIRATIARGAATSSAVVEQARPARDAAAELAERAVGRAIERLAARPATGGAQTIVLAPGLGGILVHELVGHALEGDVTARGRSQLVRLSPPIAPPNVRIVDDPCRGRAAWTVDDEGVESVPVTLIEDGRIAGQLHDIRSAAHARSVPTGHGRRSSYAEPVRPRMGCTFLESGSDSPEEVLRATSSGLLVRRMETAGTDPDTGRAFFRVADADRIESGRLAEPVLPFLLFADVVALARIDRIANDLAFDTCIGACVRDGQPLAMSVGAPTCRLGLITAFV